MYQLLIFDWDGTLMDSALKIANCMRGAAESAGIPAPSVEQAKQIIGLGLVEAINSLFPAASDAQKQAVLEAYKYQFVTADQTPQRLFEGVEQGLAELSQYGVLLAVATGKSRVGLDRAFASCNLESHFVTTRCADETRSKPHPQMLEEILEFTSIEASKAIMIGDTSFDLDMAANAKMHGLGAGYGVHQEQTLRDSGAVEVLPSFLAVKDWLCDGRLEKAFS